MLRTLVLVIVVVMAMVPAAVQAESIFIPQAHNGVRDWFTVADILRWNAENANVMPISCVAVRTEPEVLFTECAVIQAQPLTLTWDDTQGKVVAND